MVRALHRTLKWVHAGTGAQLAGAIGEYFPDVPPQRLAGALDRYKTLGLWGQDPRLPQSGYDQADVPDVELYDHRFQCEGDDSEMEYWIGVTPKVSSPASVEA